MQYSVEARIGELSLGREVVFGHGTSCSLGTDRDTAAGSVLDAFYGSAWLSVLSLSAFAVLLAVYSEADVPVVLVAVRRHVGRARPGEGGDGGVRQAWYATSAIIPASPWYALWQCNIHWPGLSASK